MALLLCQLVYRLTTPCKALSLNNSSSYKNITEMPSQGRHDQASEGPLKTFVWILGLAWPTKSLQYAEPGEDPQTLDLSGVGGPDAWGESYVSFKT